VAKQVIQKISVLLRKLFSHPAVCATGILALILLAELAAILLLNGGMFTYSLDDPYIHLRLAQNIAGGTYGLNPGEASSPSSSILWPFLLAVFAAVHVEQFAPLVINILAALMAVPILWIMLTSALGEPKDAPSRRKYTILMVFLALGFNLIALVFTGMEHSLQVLLALMLVTGLLHELATGEVSIFLAAGIVLGPLVRYENLALTLPALLFLMERGHARKALTLGALCAAPMIGFSAFLAAQGLGWLPASVFAKSAALNAAGGDIALRFASIFQRRESGLLAAGALLLMVPMLSGKTRDPESVFCATIGIAGVLHLLFGDYGWFARYEIYIWMAVLIALIYHYRATIGAWLKTVSAFSLLIILSLGLFLLTPTYVTALLDTPRSAQNIYLQQYQMHRLAVDFIREPVAVNDLGWVAYGNDNYVLDLIGLSNPAQARTEYRNLSAAWLEAQTQAKGISLAMIYDDWVPDRPAAWILLGRLRFTVPRIFIAGNSVSLYATAPDYAAALRPALAAFGATLPAGASLELEP
jgi:hypothetical protein